PRPGFLRIPHEPAGAVRRPQRRPSRRVSRRLGIRHVRHARHGRIGSQTTFGRANGHPPALRGLPQRFGDSFGPEPPPVDETPAGRRWPNEPRRARSLDSVGIRYHHRAQTARSRLQSPAKPLAHGTKLTKPESERLRLRVTARLTRPPETGPSLMPPGDC